MKRVLIQIHRILGTVLSILLVMWFATGFVMINHPYPSMKDSLHRRGLLPLKVRVADSLSAELRTLPKTLPDSLFLRMLSPSIHAFVVYQEGKVHIYPSEGCPRDRFTTAEVDLYAKRAIQSPIERVDTLTDIDQWIPYDLYRPMMPILKYHYADDAGSELYVSKVTGEGVQTSTLRERVYAWLGPIPHWLYLVELRSHREAWSGLLIVISGLGTLMCLSGLVLGVWAYIFSWRKRRRLRSPYPRGFFRWHHITGFVFGLFVFSFSFSGMMSLQKVPQWLVTTARPELADLAQDKTLKMQPEAYPLSVDSLLTRLQTVDVRQIVFRHWGTKPYYQVLTADTTLFVDASSAKALRPLDLTKEEILAWAKSLHPHDSLTISLQHSYDNYYINKGATLPLPVYRIQVQDADYTSYYIEPKTASVHYFNANTRLRKWTYHALHSFSFQGLEYHGVGWQVLMYTVLIGGGAVSLTGIVLAYRYLFKRKRKRRA